MIEPITFRCKDCGLPFLRVAGESVIVIARHHGATHYNTVSIEELKALMRSKELSKVN